jgi:hypothetical protein
MNPYRCNHYGGKGSKNMCFNLKERDKMNHIVLKNKEPV